MHPTRTAIALAILCSALPGQALEFKPAPGIAARLTGTVSFGTMIRTDDADPGVYALVPATVVPGTAAGALVGQTGGSDLNFASGRPVSTVLKALVDLDIRGQSAGFFARGSAWTDFTLGHKGVVYGNYNNGYEPGKALSDSGWNRGARFDGIDLRDIYGWARFDVAPGSSVEARLGRQVLLWGTQQFVSGGISSTINPQDLAAQVRPGALPQEARVPVGMLHLRAGISRQWNAEAFVAFESRQTEFPGCGTFFDAASLVPHGCNLTGAIASPIPGTPLATINSLTERSLLANGYYLHRNPDVHAKDGGQFGLALRYTVPALATEFGAYAMNVHNALPSFRLTVENVGGTTLPAGLAGGLARLSNANGLKYATVFAEDVRLYGFSFDTKPSPLTRFFGELAVRPNQPIGMNANDLLGAFLLRTPTSLLQLNKSILAIPAGGSFDGYDRYQVINASVGVNHVIAKALGADRVVLAAEFGVSHIAGLPDVQVMRYGRPLAYGSAPYLVNGALTACSEASPGLSGVAGKTCTRDGFTTANASGIRGRIAATYANALAGAALTPSLIVGYDISGYSYDGSYSEGRRTLRAGLRADWGRSYYADLQVTKFGGGRYNLLADRSNVMLAAGVNF